MIPAHERVARRLVVTATGCHEFVGARFRYGYGNVRVWNGERWTNKGAHIVMYEHRHGPVPPGMIVLHTCDNPPCCNADHLTVGTQRDNIHDAIRKGRIDPRANALNNPQPTDPVTRRFVPRQPAGI
jgi:hypothetical protein